MNLQTDYEMLTEQLKNLTDGERDTIANLSNASALLKLSMDALNWAGFYLVKGGELILGPFQGKPACIRIPFGKGVCGTAVSADSTQLVKNVHEFPGHIACDCASNSEIVIPLHKGGRIVAVLDMDSPLLSRFSGEDRLGLERFAAVLEKACDWQGYGV